jgi:glycine/D-amino acid oxidase-like deaminating enzyme/nitrite reductase/ring-hydroxylating ferredoxin subunit
MATSIHHQILPLESTQSVWAASTDRPKFAPLATDVDTDVCIVGAGIAGLTTAYLLTKAGKRVVVLDDGEIVSGQTEVTTAHLSDEIDDGFTRMIRLHGEENTRLAADSHAASIDCIESIVNELKIDCVFKRIDGYLFAANEDDHDYVEDEFEGAMKAGRDVSMVERCPLDYDTGPAIRYRRQARFHPLKYLAAVAEAIKAKGGQIYTGTHAEKIEGGENANVKVGKYTVRAQHIVVATNTPVNDMFAIHTKQFPYMTYAIGIRVPKGSVTDAMYWDTLDAYHYVRLQPMNGDGADAYDVLIVGGEDHKTGQAKDTLERHQRLDEWTRERFPMAGEIEFTWAGQCMETIDGLAFIGHNPGDEKNVYVATGDSGMGITHGTIAGMLLCDMILGKENPWEKIYDPSRKATRGMDSFLKENLNVAAQYLDWVMPGEVSSKSDIEFGSGAILRQGLTKLAVYRDEAGKCHKMSAVCPHLQCIVEWNAAEKSWDCPCHGSRFDKLGKCINGPSNIDLSPAEE